MPLVLSTPKEIGTKPLHHHCTHSSVSSLDMVSTDSEELFRLSDTDQSTSMSEPPSVKELEARKILDGGFSSREILLKKPEEIGFQIFRLSQLEKGVSYVTPSGNYLERIDSNCLVMNDLYEVQLDTQEPPFVPEKKIDSGLQALEKISSDNIKFIDSIESKKNERRLTLKSTPPLLNLQEGDQIDLLQIDDIDLQKDENMKILRESKLLSDKQENEDGDWVFSPNIKSPGKKSKLELSIAGPLNFDLLELDLEKDSGEDGLVPFFLDINSPMNETFDESNPLYDDHIVEMLTPRSLARRKALQSNPPEVKVDLLKIDLEESTIDEDFSTPRKTKPSSLPASPSVTTPMKGIDYKPKLFNPSGNTEPEKSPKKKLTLKTRNTTGIKKTKSATTPATTEPKKLKPVTGSLGRNKPTTVNKRKNVSTISFEPPKPITRTVSVNNFKSEEGSDTFDLHFEATPTPEPSYMKTTISSSAKDRLGASRKHVFQFSAKDIHHQQISQPSVKPSTPKPRPKSTTFESSPVVVAKKTRTDVVTPVSAKKVKTPVSSKKTKRSRKGDIDVVIMAHTILDDMILDAVVQARSPHQPKVLLYGVAHASPSVLSKLQHQRMQVEVEMTTPEDGVVGIESSEMVVEVVYLNRNRSRTSNISAENLVHDDAGAQVIYYYLTIGMNSPLSDELFETVVPIYNSSNSPALPRVVMKKSFTYTVKMASDQQVVVNKVLYSSIMLENMHKLEQYDFAARRGSLSSERLQPVIDEIMDTISHTLLRTPSKGYGRLSKEAVAEIPSISPNSLVKMVDVTERDEFSLPPVDSPVMKKRGLKAKLKMAPKLLKSAKKSKRCSIM